MLSVSLKGKEGREKHFLSAAQNAYGTVCGVGEIHIPPPCNPSVLSILAYSWDGIALVVSVLHLRCICSANSEIGVLWRTGKKKWRKERGTVLEKHFFVGFLCKLQR